MTSGFKRSPRLFKGALIELTEPFLGPVPNVIVFQYNPETLSRTMSPWSSSSKEGGTYWEELQSNKQPFDPGESFILNLVLDATDALEKPETHPVAVATGVADRISALEMLLYPTGESLLGESFAKVFGKQVAARGKVPVVLFVWGPGRVLPVRLTSFSIEEQAFSPALYPIRATVSVGLQVLTAEAIKAGKKPKDKKGNGGNEGNQGVKLSASEQLAVKAYDYTRRQKERLARANLVNSVEEVLGQTSGVSEMEGLLGL